MKVERSVCGKFVRVTIAGTSHVVMIEDWSRSIGRPGEFVITLADKAKLS